MQGKVPQHKAVKKVCTIILGISLLCLLTSAVAGKLHIQAWNQTGERLGFEPNASGLEDYIREHIKPGMSREEVYSELNQITHVKTRPYSSRKSEVCEQVWISVGLISGPLTPHYDMCFDLDEILLSISISS